MTEKPAAKKKPEIVKVGWQELDEKFLPDFLPQRGNAKFMAVTQKVVDWATKRPKGKFLVFDLGIPFSENTKTYAITFINRHLRIAGLPYRTSMNKKKNLYFVYKIRTIKKKGGKQ